MTETRLIDSSIWLDFINKQSEPTLNQRIQELIEIRHAAWCPMIRLELQRSTKDRESALSLLAEVILPLEIENEVWEMADEIARTAYRVGKVIPNTDILIYATALHHGTHVFHNDKHFDWLDEITDNSIGERLLPS